MRLSLDWDVLNPIENAARRTRTVVALASLAIALVIVAFAKLLGLYHSEDLVGLLSVTALVVVLLLLLRRIVHGAPLVEQVIGRQRPEDDRDDFFVLSPDVLLVGGFDGRVKRLSPSVTQILGFWPGELVGKRLAAFVHPDDLAKVANAIDQLARGKLAGTLVNRCRCNDGSYKWLAWTSKAAVAKGLFYAIGRDVSAHRETDRATREAVRGAEQARQESEARFRAVFDAAPLGIAVFTAPSPESPGTSKPPLTNSTLRRMLGYTDGEFASVILEDLIHPQDLERARLLSKEVFSGARDGGNIELRCTRKDGSAIWASVALSRLNQRDGPPSLVVTAEEITAKKQAADEVAQRKGIGNRFSSRSAILR